MPVDRLWTEELVLGIEEGDERKGQIGEVVRAKREPGHRAFSSIAEIVVLVGSVINPVSRADHGLPVEHRGSPGNADPRTQVSVVRRIIGSSFGTESAAPGDIDDRGSVQYLVRDRV